MSVLISLSGLHQNMVKQLLASSLLGRGNRPALIIKRARYISYTDTTNQRTQKKTLEHLQNHRDTFRTPKCFFGNLDIHQPILHTSTQRTRVFCFFAKTRCVGRSGCFGSSKDAHLQGFLPAESQVGGAQIASRRRKKATPSRGFKGSRAVRRFLSTFQGFQKAWHFCNPRLVGCFFLLRWVAGMGRSELVWKGGLLSTWVCLQRNFKIWEENSWSARNTLKTYKEYGEVGPNRP